MKEILVAVAIFLLLSGSAIAAMLASGGRHPHHSAGASGEVIRNIANIFALMTSLVLGLMISSSRSSFEQTDHSVHALASQLIVVDLALSELGPAAAPVRAQLAAYVEETIRSGWNPESGRRRFSSSGPTTAEMLKTLREIPAASADLRKLRDDARQKFESVVELKWEIGERAEGVAAGGPFVTMLVAWLVVIFASFGFRAPRSPLMVATFSVSAALIAGTLYLVLDMQLPFEGPIQVSPAPLHRALQEIRS